MIALLYYTVDLGSGKGTGMKSQSFPKSPSDAFKELASHIMEFAREPPHEDDFQGIRVACVSMAYDCLAQKQQIDQRDHAANDRFVTGRGKMADAILASLVG
jgi:hypothetical protein